MNRDLGNEFIVAIAAVGVIAVALVFGILLTLSSNSRTVTPTSIAAEVTAATTEAITATAPKTANQSVEVKQTEGEKTETRTVVVTPTTTHTIAPSSTHTLIMTPTPSVTFTPTPSFTATRTSTNTSTPPFTPTRTSTSTPELTHTASITPSLTATRTPSPTRTNTATLKPAFTAAPTLTLTPTRTPTFTLTRTPSPTGTFTFTPSQTSSLTPTFTPTWTPSATATRLTITLTPYMTATSGIVPTPIPTETPFCVKRTDWQTYTVKQGDTLFLISLAVRSTTKELSEANCLSDADRILTGDRLRVPRLPVEPISTGEVVSSLGCADSAIAAITSPYARQRISGTFTLRGTANIADFWYYKVEVRPDPASVYNFYSQSETPVINGDLATIDSSIFDSGLHWIRVVVVKKDASVIPSAVCVVPVYFN